MDDARELMDKLIGEGYELVLETNGSIDLAPIKDIAGSEKVSLAVDVKCPSSNHKESFVKDNLQLLTKKDMLKFVLADASDYEFAKKFIEENDHDTNMILTPVDGIDLAWLAQKVADDKLQVRVLPQLHKLIWGPDARGV
jgi:7-carboxy-7-deazaguanine synthase